MRSRARAAAGRRVFAPGNTAMAGASAQATADVLVTPLADQALRGAFADAFGDGAAAHLLDPWRA
ncbi:MAG: hypothetical protein ACOYOH_22845 [Paracraurococcus sp.]